MKGIHFNKNLSEFLKIVPFIKQEMIGQVDCYDHGYHAGNKNSEHEQNLVFNGFIRAGATKNLSG